MSTSPPPLEPSGCNNDNSLSSSCLLLSGAIRQSGRQILLLLQSCLALKLSNSISPSLSSIAAEFPEKRPQLFTEHTRYEPGDVLRANCSTPPSRPRAELRFTINQVPVSMQQIFVKLIERLDPNRGLSFYGFNRLIKLLSLSERQAGGILGGAAHAQLSRVHCLMEP